MAGKNMTEKEKEDRTVEKLLQDLEQHERVQEMGNYVQHGRISTLEHCRSVTKLSLWLDQKLHLGSDRDTLALSAMLHDFYLYDWHRDDDGTHPWHGFHHADKARDNAVKFFDVDHRVQKAIESHMWPLNLTRVPKSREAWIVCLADKWVSLQETLFMRGSRGSMGSRENGGITDEEHVSGQVRQDGKGPDRESDGPGTDA